MFGENNIDKLYKDYYKSVVEYAHSICGQRAWAEDIAQETFISLNSRNVKFPTETALRSYLFTSAKNLALDYLKHKKVEERYAERYIAEGSDEISLWESQFDEELMNMLFKAIDKLPARCREIFLMYLDGMSNEQIALRLDIAIDTVKTQKKRAMRALKSEFGNSDDPNLFMLLHILSMGV